MLLRTHDNLLLQLVLDDTGNDMLAALLLSWLTQDWCCHVLAALQPCSIYNILWLA